MNGVPPSPRRTLVVMVKVPVAGRVKTRLARSIGTIPATSFYRDAIAGLSSGLAAPRRWTLLFAVAPGAEHASRAIPVPLTARIAQSSGDLGRRMQSVFDRCPPGPVIIIGSDILGITRSDIAHAFHCLEGGEAVIGPSADGGYWLIGLKRRPRHLKPFANVRWSTDEAMAGTLRNLAGNRVGLVTAKADVDDGVEWSRTAAIRGRRIVRPTPASPPSSR